MKQISLVVLLTLLTGCAANQPVESEPSSQLENGVSVLEAGMRELSRNAKRAKEEYFEVVVADCEATYGNSDERFYYARTPAESLFYLIKSAAEEQEASVLRVPCSEAHYLAAYASLDLGNILEAEAHLTSALTWSPENPQYLSEYAYIKQIQKDWESALAKFSQAEKNTNAFSPEEVKQVELSRAKRGVGYSLIELGRLDEAETKFLECLELDQNDAAAKHELEYIAEMRKQSNDVP